jgi:hypothetical protein
LAAPESFSSIAAPEQRSAALFTELGKVLTHPRCVNCHPAGDRPRQADFTRLLSRPSSVARMILGFRQCAAQSATSAPISNLSACRATRNGTLRRVKWVGKERCSARSAPSSRIPNAMAAGG